MIFFRLQLEYYRPAECITLEACYVIPLHTDHSLVITLKSSSTGPKDCEICAQEGAMMANIAF
jgi:hypothetical protein